MANDASVNITAETSGFARGVEAARGQLSSLQQVVGQLQTSFGGLKDAASGVAEGVKKVFDTAKQVAEWADKMGSASEKMQQLGVRVGMTQSQLQGWNAVAGLTGHSTDTIAQAFTALAENSAKAGKGSKEQAAALQDLGLKASDAVNPNDMMLKIAQSFAAMGDSPGASARKVSDAMALMGTSGAELVPVLNRGVPAIQQMIDKGREYGTVLSGPMNDAANDAADKIDTMKVAMDGFSTTLFAAVAPAISQVAEALAGVIKTFTDAIKDGTTLNQILRGVAAAAIAVGTGITTYVIVSLVQAAIQAIATSGAFVALQAAMLAAQGGGFAGAIRAVIGVLTSLASTAIPAAIAGLRALTAAMLSNPVTALAVGVSLLASGLFLLATREDASTKATKDLSDAQKQLKSDTADITRMTKDEVKEHQAAAQAKLKSAQASLELALADATRAQSAAKAAAEELQHASGRGADAAFGQAARAEAQLKTANENVATLRATIKTLQADLDKLGQWKDPSLQPTDTGNAKATASSAGRDIVQVWEDTFHRTQVLQGASLKDQTQAEIDFWKSKLGLTRTGSDQWWAVKSKLYELDQTKAREAADQTLAGYAKQMDAAAGDAKAQEAIEDGKVAYIEKTYGKQSKELAAALDERQRLIDQHAKEALKKQADADAESNKQRQADLKTRLELEQVADQAELAGIEARAQRGEISAIEAAAQTKVIHQRQVQEQKDYEDAVFALELKGYEDELRLMRAGTPEYDKVLRDREKALRDHNARVKIILAQGGAQETADTDKVTSAIKAKWQAITGPIASGFSNMIHGMITGGMTLRQGLLQIGDTILKGMIDNFVKMGEEWLITHVFMKQTSAAWHAFERILGITGQASNAAVGVADINVSAARAGAATYASVAAIPVIGPMLAPEAASAAYAATLSFADAVAFSAAGGWGQVPFDGAVTELHKNEMVLPASIATPLRSALGVGQGGVLAGGAAGTVGDIHIHTMEPRTMQWWLKNGGGVEIKRYLNQALRSRLMPQPF